jgi:sarcosine oxidase gamma subunit
LAAAVCTDEFLVSDVGGCLFLKLCGFVESQRAEIRDVSENHLQLRIGGSSLLSLLAASACPVDLEIRFTAAAEASRNPQARIEVTIWDKRWLGSEDRFEMAARRVLWQLKYHLMAV